MVKPKGNSGNQSNYVTVEDTALCRVWCNVTSDGITGVYQNLDEFWERVREGFEADDERRRRIGDSVTPRGAQGLQVRFGIVSRAVGKFIECVRRAEQTAASGTSPADITLNAGTLYQQSSKGKSFEFNGAYQILSKYPKYTAGMEDSRPGDKL
ncbi:hypothetical protein JG688_00011847 [Phytophthora aleatoria]|uniref:Uncharacterized protein n=1 Tax=Phytophthora aleatoria TaxID=2496075 RepID=A0A8J5INQ9_9STRA|nr:hypothetical protein JG688_00011847 [Phytophthora aleatoria]